VQIRDLPGNGAEYPHILAQELFRGVLARERRRSGRSNRPFGLLLLKPSSAEGTRANSRANWDAVIDALVAAKRDTDIVGWLEERALIGAIVPDLGEPNLSDTLEQLGARCRREVARRLDRKAPGGVSIQFHLYPTPQQVAQEPEALHPALTLSPRRSHARRRDTIKRGFDVGVSLTLLGLLSPLLLFLGVLVKLTSRGKVLFRQVRIGENQKPFTMLKFRTMQSNADQKVHQDYVSSFIKGRGQAHEIGQNGFFKITNDPRVTSIGRILRSTSLDELPQLWNVLRGEMSLVGPRPPLPYELEQYEPWHRRRVLEAKPGITGVWQVTGRSRTTFDEMVRLDLSYARTRSLWTDIRILLATPAAALSRRGAC
jgi:lipopolysaccharide/colanic/teichoic acid biosynthesis glycosyltransferase